MALQGFAHMSTLTEVGIVVLKPVDADLHRLRLLLFVAVAVVHEDQSQAVVPRAVLLVFST